MTKPAAELLDDLRAAPWAGPGPVIRELRRGRGMRLKDLAVEANLSIGYLSRLERQEAGGDNPSLTNLEALARALAIPLTTLLPPGAAAPETVDTTVAESLIGREVLLAVTHRQPVTLPTLERACQRAGDRAAIASALDHLIARGLVRRLPPAAPGKPSFYVTEWERHI
jgi:transcriptional regulator with XRE-family HTH domain